MRDYGQQKVLEYAVQMNGKKAVFQAVCRQNLEMNGHSAPKTGLRDPSAAVPIGIAGTGAFLFLAAGRSERREE